ncbi:unnamed protein product [Vitrella brassicaformis CCMP3155]|uniref:BTB domain-containing protein n=1 Tax=Vitrella brassicaformis (strain CCMP3155) TaxID=1169540 RepID=A0A0G4G4J9_VITBC|nr:unnamed protein product [Vitrella brassicaformis CCMP3155]|mmetsp:Transcript_36931/g.92616  ORF Transcript_36931/g.92616 Transcript_36931/m.92616 type:complete len:219 (-) Transcript_36931:84-740(-)|eukprot:CEM22871.1 unnamed protein product [Vitrella brassicaformis CCMP3155]
MTTPVRLDVGGTEFKTAKSTLGRHPQTLLGQFVTNESTAEYQLIQQGQPVFIDADPSLFPYVLDFYRHGTPIFVDGSVDVRRVMRELHFFGIQLDRAQLQPPDEPETKPPKSETLRRLAKRFAELMLREDWLRKSVGQSVSGVPPLNFTQLLQEAITEVSEAEEYAQALKTSQEERGMFLVCVEAEVQNVKPRKDVQVRYAAVRPYVGNTDAVWLQYE